MLECYNKYVCVHVYVHMYAYIRMYTDSNISMWAYVSVSEHTHTHALCTNLWKLGMQETHALSFLLLSSVVESRKTKKNSQFFS
jgi:hypothetical protein